MFGVPRMIWGMLEICTLGQSLSSQERKANQRISYRNSAISRTKGEWVPCAAKNTRPCVRPRVSLGWATLICLPTKKGHQVLPGKFFLDDLIVVHGCGL